MNGTNQENKMETTEKLSVFWKHRSVRTGIEDSVWYSPSPGYTNLGRKEISRGWCGETNNVNYYVEGIYTQNENGGFSKISDADYIRFVEQGKIEHTKNYEEYKIDSERNCTLYPSDKNPYRFDYVAPQR